MATKKITELPFIVTVSGSSVFDNPSVNSVVPVVLYGTTYQITVENFSKFTNLYAAQTGSQNIFTQNQWFNTTVSASTINVGTLGVGGNTTIAGTLGVTGNGTIGGNLAVAGRITAEEFYTEITTASVIYASGSTKFGDDTTDTHEFTGSINVSGSVIYNGVILSNIDANTIQRLQQTTQSLQVATASLQAFSSSVNDQLQRVYQTTQSLHVATASLEFHSASVDSQLLAIQQTTQSLQVATASLNVFTASQDDRNFIISQVTGSFAGEIGGLEAYTASLKTAAIVSSSTQILNYNVFAVTSSNNTFYGNQSITGSLSVGRGQFNVVTGSGGLTSSLTFTHNITSPGDGNAILELRHNNRIYNDDIAIKLKADFAGAYLDYEEDTVPYSILSVQSFANKNVYIHQDTRLLFSNLTVDDNLVVKQDTRMTGSLFVMGVITGSILATNGVISSSNQLFELNQFTASQDDRNFVVSQVTGSLIGITNGLMAFTAALDNTYATDAQLYQLYQATQSLELHSGSMIGVTNGLMAYTASNTTLNTGLRGEVDGIEAYTASLKAQAIVSSSTQVQNYDVFALNSNLYTSTGSLIGITNGLMAFTAALDSTYATDAQLYELYAATASLNTATGSIKAEIAGIEEYTASLKGAAIVSSSTQVQNYDVFALNSNLYESTGSIKGEIAGIEAYTASLKSAAIVSSSQQITNYYKFAETASANTFYGVQSISGSVFVTSDSGFGTSDATGSGILKVISAGTQNAFSIGQSNSKRFTGFGANDLKVYGDDYFITTVDAFPISIGTNNISRITIANDGGINATGAITASNFKVPSGGGLDFSATSNGSGTTTSELLNDYEEGSFTAVIAGGTSAGTATYTDQNGKYTKIGNCVHFRMDVIWSGHTGTGTLKITGLPFTIGQNYQSVGSVRFNQSGSANHYIAGGFIYQTQFELNQIPVGGGTPASFDITSAGDIRVSGHYFV
jgi:hypothetical protein